MKILANLGKIDKTHTAFVVEDAYHPNYVIASGFNKKTKEWDSAQYFDGNLEAFCDAVLEAKRGISPSRIQDMLFAELDDVDDLEEHFEIMGFDMSEKEALYGD